MTKTAASSGLLLCLGDISLGNLPKGEFCLTKIARHEALLRVSSFLENGSLIGLFEFGPVPDARKEETFAGILRHLARGAGGVSIPPESFFMRDTGEAPVTDEGRSWPNPPGLFQVSPDRPMLVVTYFFELIEASLEDISRPFRTRVSSRMDFHWLEAKPDCA